MNVLRKIVDKTKIDRIRSQQIRGSCGIQSIDEQKKEEENWTIMQQEWMLGDQLKPQETIQLEEEDHEDALKAD